MSQTRIAYKSSVDSTIFTNTNRLIKGNTVRDKLKSLADSALFFDSDANVANGYMAIDAFGFADVSFIKSATPTGKFLRDDGTFATPASSASNLQTTLGVGNTTGANNILFDTNYGIDTKPTASVLNIGTTNASVINYGNSTTTHNFLGTAIYELQVNSYVKDKLITLNTGGAISSGVGVGFEVEENSIITGYFKTNAARNGYSILTPTNNFFADLNLNLLSANRAFSLPDTSGTLVVSSQLTSTYVPYTGASSGLNLGSNTLSVQGNVNIGNATATNQKILRIGQGTAIIDIGNTGSSFPGIWFNQTTPTASNALLSTSAFNGTMLNDTTSNGRLQFRVANTQIGQFYYTGTGSTKAFLLFNDATSLPAGSGSTSFNSVTAVKQWLAGNVTIQYDALFDELTYEATGASVFTDVFRFYIKKNIAGLNTTITNNWALGTLGDVFINGSLKITDGNEGAGKVWTSDATGFGSWQTPTGGGSGTVTSVSGTSARITSSGGATPTIDIASTYAGQASITTLGTIAIGVWQGTAITDSYISSASAWNAKQSALVSGTNIKTINGANVLGSGNIATVAGSSTQVQFNNAGALAADALFTFDATSKALKVRRERRTVTVTQAAQPIINSNLADVVSITGLAQDITSLSANLSGTPLLNEVLEVQFTDNGTPRTITFGASFTGITSITTTSTVLLRTYWQWDSVASKWSFVGSSVPSSSGGYTRAYVPVNSSTSVANAASTDYFYDCINTITLTLPTAVGNTNIYTIRNDGTGIITINTTSSQLINDVSIININYQYTTIQLQSDGANWCVIGG